MQGKLSAIAMQGKIGAIAMQGRSGRSLERNFRLSSIIQQVALMLKRVRIVEIKNI
jgi:hypothetical protein